MANGIPLDHVIARNVRDLIEERGWRHVDVSARMKVIGFDWTTNRVAQTVTLRRSLGLFELAALCNVFGVGLDRMLTGDDLIALPMANAHGAPALPLSTIRAQLLGEGGQRFGDTAERSVVHVEVPDEMWDAAARKLGVDVDMMRMLAHRLWNTDRLTDVRDGRAGDLSGVPARAAQAKRGHAMRAMLAEMREEKPRFEAEIAAARSRARGRRK